jgi:3-methyladenine DNA glycosylase AlkD
MPKQPVKQLLGEVEHRLAALARNIPEAERERLRIYHGSNVPHLGLAVPVQREALRRGYSFSGLPFGDQLSIWDAVWRDAQHHEVKTQALYYCASRRKPDEFRQLWPVVQGWIETVDCWDTSDELSSIYARILEVDALADQVYAVLQSWNKSPNPWKRRQSILSLLYYSRSRRSVLPASKIFPLIEALLKDSDRFVQKAVGWALREAVIPYPAETEAFIRCHAQTLSSLAFTEATRKLPPAQRVEIVARRRAGRATSNSPKD